MGSSRLAVDIERVSAGTRRAGPDRVAVEEPLEIRVGYATPEGRAVRSLAITMRTPGDDLELALGRDAVLPAHRQAPGQEGVPRAAAHVSKEGQRQRPAPVDHQQRALPLVAPRRKIVDLQGGDYTKFREVVSQNY